MRRLWRDTPTPPCKIRHIYTVCMASERVDSPPVKHTEREWRVVGEDERVPAVMLPKPSAAWKPKQAELSTSQLESS